LREATRTTVARTAELREVVAQQTEDGDRSEAQLGDLHAAAEQLARPAEGGLPERVVVEIGAVPPPLALARRRHEHLDDHRRRVVRRRTHQRHHEQRRPAARTEGVRQACLGSELELGLVQERVRSTRTGWASHKGRPSTPTPTDPLRQLTAADRVERPAPAGALVTGVWVVGDFLVGVPGALVAGLLVSVPRRVATISFSASSLSKTSKEEFADTQAGSCKSLAKTALVLFVLGCALPASPAASVNEAACCNEAAPGSRLGAAQPPPRAA
jgi:hypothetical protein